MNTPIFSSSDLDQLQHQLDSWRQRQSGRCRLPAALWQAAAQIARKHGVSRVARALRIDFYKLQRRVETAAAAGSLAAGSPAFVQLKLDPLPTRRSEVGAVELCDGPHRRLRIETGSDPASWLALAESFWRARP